MVNLSRAQVWNGQPDNTWSGDSGTRGKGLTIDEDAKVNGLIPKWSKCILGEGPKSNLPLITSLLAEGEFHYAPNDLAL